ncbi:single-stranded-DNA-specific exonuclease RecJ [Clostridium bowmanii]|uniref:single-stranded-DNA-specific exonuclease RecJ n=1 Tax=Clostridium bowmanii TaxID=132925 RepID=UPI001C0B7930|nr:single-stranded-DNA-specific exonuclease RecJ [Clostridium bowmanii]MBU3190757.1 single-stranded-DNA-specific exonuclease RecJ [Clostridium bowmanii]MCA1074997.1 single-stranded-DNA-specific exonuclease RecJ [Clostridium bowmanii]
MSQRLNISEILCRILINRGVTDDESVVSFVNSNINGLTNPILMKDLEIGIKIIKLKINENKKIRIVGDFDVDGIISTYLLYKGLTECGANVDYEIPHRISDGYGINKNIIEIAKNDGIDTIITCDNGISAIEQIAYAKSLGMTCIITDHHDVPFKEDSDGSRTLIIPNADSIINCKQIDCEYPFKLLCGAGVAFKFLQALYEEMGQGKDKVNALIEYVAIATVCDVVDLIGENRIIVQEGLKLLNNTQNMGLKALISETGIEGKKIGVYHLGFVIGPCLNASGRLDSAKKGLKLLLSEDYEEAKCLAKELFELNKERKEMTLKGVEDAIEIIEKQGIRKDKILVVYNADLHESIAGIIAGKIREKYHSPTFVLTDAEHGIKGSGRSIEQYNMFEGLFMCKDLLLRFGGHPMAAGLSMEPENLEKFRVCLNTQTTLTDEDLIPKVYIDMQLPFNNISISLVEEIETLEPYGKGNHKPIFAEKNIKIAKATILGAKKNVLKFKFLSTYGKTIEGIYFGDIDKFKCYLINKFGDEETMKMFNGVSNNIRIDITFTVSINEYMGNRSVQVVIGNYR